MTARRLALPLAAALLGSAAVASAFPFATLEDFAKFAGKAGSVGSDGKPRRTCICRAAPAPNGVGNLHFVYEAASDFPVAECRVPRAATADGPISSFLVCSAFDVLG